MTRCPHPAIEDRRHAKRARQTGAHRDRHRSPERRQGWRAWFCAVIAGAALPLPTQARPETSKPLMADQLAVVVNDADMNSVEVAAYYQKARKIPEANMVHVSLPDAPRKLNAQEFAVLQKQINARLGANIQAIVLVWTAPYAVACNSITSALTLGFDAQQCKQTCAPGRPSPYFDSNSRQPLTDLGLRPTMLLPTDSVERAKALIDRGVASNFRIQAASAYYLITSDKARNSRAYLFPPTSSIPMLQFHINTLQQNSLSDKKDIMIYQTGMITVPGLNTLEFLPGALADHLTSTGGDLLGTTQMSSLRWLDAGATASYGTVSEPCNHWQKFPQPQVLLRHYLGGETAIEAYWKSLAWPAQGLVIGEPLAAPYRRWGNN